MAFISRCTPQLRIHLHPQVNVSRHGLQLHVPRLFLGDHLGDDLFEPHFTSAHRSPGGDTSDTTPPDTRTQTRYSPSSATSHPQPTTTFERLQAGLQNGQAEVVQEPTDQPYGVRDSAFRDPAGNLIRIQELQQ